MAGGLAAAKVAGFRNNAVVDSQRLGRLPYRNMSGVFGECCDELFGLQYVCMFERFYVPNWLYL
jgi:hypothetical protein